MCVLEFYVDDSGEPTDPNHDVISVAGYLGNVGGWTKFNEQWSSALRWAEVPYFHMREFWNRDGIYKNLKQDKTKEAQFLALLIRAIGENLQFCASASIRLDDLNKFNTETGLSLDPYALALYGCLIELRRACPDDEIRIIVDRTNNAAKKITQAKKYAATDTWADLKVANFLITALEKQESFKTVFPIQAADFMASELRKSCQERIGWIPKEEDRENLSGRIASYAEWAFAFFLEQNRFPRERRSARNLDQAVSHFGYLWDFTNIMGAHENRHKEGWG
ncbi:MAG: hypothetical protein WCI56_06110 [Hyphomicrobiales bacterium]